MSRFEPGLIARALTYVGRPLPAEPGEPASALEIAAELCKRFEGFRSHPYLCPAGVPTIGYGATYYLDGRAVTLRDPPISQETAERLLLRQIETVYLPAVLRQCPAAREWSAGMLAAIIDWTFNLGEGKLRASTLRRRLNEARWGEVPVELRKWVYGGGRRLRGLELRREAEVEVSGAH